MKILFHDLNIRTNEPRDVFFSISNMIEVCRKGPGGPPVGRNKLLVDCKVMSRNHAVILFENNKFYIRKVWTTSYPLIHICFG